MGRQLEVAWAAGFFDGEGCISIARKARNARVSFCAIDYYSLSITAFQNTRAPLDVLLSLFGGAVRPRNAGWIWVLNGHGTKVAFEEMLPFLIVKKSQALLALDFQCRKTSVGGKYPSGLDARKRDEQDYHQMRQLKLQILNERAA